ncbi:alpha/beta hydrolase [Virgisporangium ochraceum]|uniref:Alpha/beta hydrolase n=1 Tax=Virgisporangium ochraceum TaxID=65505 RepID=A0A8J3ZX22_9ACTN|nr:alpha/beta hydrolase [Virgisporangium ochraceum]GIJ71176.1 hypothetical protein Voc01_060930 [Virgisporangium ochraceum]
MADALLLPGRGYGPTTGLLWYAGDVPVRRGATLHRHSWAGAVPDPFAPATEGWVAGQVAPLLDGRPLVIGKSLGSHAAALAADRALPAIWLTPLLTAPWIVAALGRAPAPFLLVGGTADTLWDGAVARRLTPHVLEVTDADHGLSVPGPAVASVNVLARVVDAMDAFLDGVPWPSRSSPRSGDRRITT